MRTDLRWDCPSIPANHGRPLTDYREAVRAYLPLVIPPDAADRPAPPFFHRVQLGWEKLELINALFVRLAGNKSFDLTTRSPPA